MLEQRYFDEWAEIRDGTRQLALLLPDDKLDFRPHPEMVPLGELSRHIIGSIYFMLGRWLGREVKAPDYIRRKDPLGRDGFLTMLTETDALVQGTLKDLSPDDLKKESHVTPGGKSHSYGWVVWHLGEHEIHHRAQLKMYLKLLGVDTSGVPL